MVTEQLTGGEALVRALIQHDVDTVFGLPGAQMYGFFDGLYTHKDEIQTFTARHEQGAAYMAFGAAKSSGTPAVYSVVPGPGVLNTTAALCTAWGCNTPVLCVTGQVPSAFLNQGRGHLHELPDQLATLKTLTKWSHRIDTVADASQAVSEAFRQMLSGRPGPVTLEMCWDIMAGPGSYAEHPNIDPDPIPEPDDQQLSKALELIATAKQPMIMVGSGAQHASEEVLALAEALGSSVTAFRSGRGIVAEDHPLGVGSAAGNELWAETDLLIGIGSRCEMQYMRWATMMALESRNQRAPAGPRLIRIDIDPTEMTRLVPDAALITDAAYGSKLLLERMSAENIDHAANRLRINEAKLTAREKFIHVQPEVDYLDVIRDVLPRNGFLVEELCQAGFASYYAFPVYEPRTYVTPGFQGTLGYGFPTALGVKAKNPDKAVVSIIGDGGFMFGITELATAVQHNLGVVTLIFNNSSFGNVRRDQMTRYEGRVIGADLVNPDFLKLADSFGLAGYRVDSPDALRPVLEKAISDDAPALVEIVIEKDSEQSPWEFISFQR